MRPTRAFFILFAALAQTGCQSAGNLIQAPIDMMGRMFQAVGRTVNMASDERSGSPPASVEDREASAAVAAVGASSVKPETPAAQIVQR